MVEFGHKLDEKMKAMPTETKENVQGTNSEQRKLGLKSMVWTTRKKETSNQKRMKKKEFKKMRRGLGTSGTTLKVPTSEHHQKCSNTGIMGVLEGEDEE